MKTLLLGASLMIASTASSFAQDGQTTDFRGFSWGTSLAQVQSQEKAQLVVKIKDDELQYADLLAGSDCYVIYIFNDNDKLISGNYVFTKKYSNPELYLQDYNKFKDLLTQKYGKPVSDDTHFHSNAPSVEKHSYGQAISDGYLTMDAIWNVNGSLIKIALISTDRSPSLQIHYTSDSLNGLENKAALKQVLTKL
ncbi:hypothetical protein [Puia dinghuensis]|nr:hypothetical protein [Puia dinghuensis]